MVEPTVVVKVAKMAELMVIPKVEKSVELLADWLADWLVVA